MDLNNILFTLTSISRLYGPVALCSVFQLLSPVPSIQNPLSTIKEAVFEILQETGIAARHRPYLYQLAKRSLSPDLVLRLGIHSFGITSTWWFLFKALTSSVR